MTIRPPMGDGSKMEGSVSVPDEHKLPVHWLVAISLVVVILVASSAACAIWLCRGHVPSPDLVVDLKLSYIEDELSSITHISVNGTVYNNGDVGCYVWLSLIIGDGNGWLPGTQIHPFWIAGEGGSVNVHWDSSLTCWTETLFLTYHITYRFVGQ